MTQVQNGGKYRTIYSPEEFDEKVDKYIARCKAENIPLTLTGMILALGLKSRESLDNYLKYDGFYDSVKRAKLFIENAYELKLHSNIAAGPIFALKNFGWKDERYVDQKNTNTVDDAELDKKINEILGKIGED